MGFFDIFQAKENKKLKEKINKLENNFSNLQNSYQDVSNSHQSLERSYQKLLENNNKLETSRQRKEKKYTDLQKEFHFFQTGYDRLINILNNLKNENNEFFLQNTQLISALEEYRSLQSNFYTVDEVDLLEDSSDVITPIPEPVVKTGSVWIAETITSTSETGNSLNFKTREFILLEYINGLFKTDFREYLIESRKYREQFKKNTSCDICSTWDTGLYGCCGGTYCEKHFATHQVVGGKHREPDREYKIMAINHGAAITFDNKDYLIKRWRESNNFKL